MQSFLGCTLLKNWECLNLKPTRSVYAEPDCTQDNMQDKHISRSSVAVYTRKLGLQYEVPVFHIRIITQMFCQVIVILLPISRQHPAKSVPPFCQSHSLATIRSILICLGLFCWPNILLNSRKLRRFGRVRRR